MQKKLHRYWDSEGVEHELWVPVDLKRELEAIERADRRGEAKWREKHVLMTDLSPEQVAPDRTQPTKTKREDLGNPWEGPRYHFSHLLGESQIWSGPQRGGRCRICRGGKLDLGCYCLGCDRSGRDLAIPRPTSAELRRIRAHVQEPGLKGGVG